MGGYLVNGEQVCRVAHDSSHNANRERTQYPTAIVNAKHLLAGTNTAQATIVITVGGITGTEQGLQTLLLFLCGDSHYECIIHFATRFRSDTEKPLHSHYECTAQLVV